MDKLTYSKVGDYLIPDLMMDGEDETEEMPLGKYGMLYRTFLMEHHRGIYTSLLLTGKLEPHLREIDNEARQQVDWMISEEMKRYGERNRKASIRESIKNYEPSAPALPAKGRGLQQEAIG